MKDAVCYEPCGNCPFRTDRPGFLSCSRAREIIAGITRQVDFHCHKTVDYSAEDEDGDGRSTSESKICAGYAILCEKMNKPTQMMRIAERIGMYDMRRLNMDAPVHKTVSAFINAQEPSRPIRSKGFPKRVQIEADHDS